MGHLVDHCRWLRLAWVHQHWQILTKSFDSFIVSWSFFWFPVVSWCSLSKRERCKLIQDHARKCKIQCYIIYNYHYYHILPLPKWWAVWGRVFEIVVGCNGFWHPYCFQLTFLRRIAEIPFGHFMILYVIFCVYLRIIVHFAWSCLLNGVFFEKCKLDCFGCWKWWCFQKISMPTQSNLHLYYYLFNVIHSLCHKGIKRWLIVYHCTIMWHILQSIFLLA